MVPGTPNRSKHESAELGVQQFPETAPEHGSGGGQDSEDVYELVQSGRSRGKFQCPCLHYSPY